MELLRKSTFQTSQVLQNKSLYELAEIVLQDAGLASDEYAIDEALDDIVIPYSWFNPVSHREALRLIAEAGLAAAFQNRDGKIQIESFLITGDEPVLEITEDDYFPPLRAPSRQDQVANEIIVYTQPLRPVTTPEEVYRSNEPIPFPVGQGEQPPGYVTWDGQLEAAFRQIDLLMEQLYILSETSAAAFGQLKAGLAESGTALKRLMMAPLAKVNRIRMRFDPALKEVLWLASILEKAQGMAGAVVLEDIHIDWKDGLPDDDNELTQNETQRYTAGLTSLESALRRLYGLEGDALQEEIDRIKGEQTWQGATELPPITLPPAEGEGEE